MKHPSIAYLVTEDWYFWKHRAPLARAAQAAGYDVHVIAAPGAHVDAIREAGFTYHPLSLHRRSTNPLRQLTSIRALTALYRDINPTLVHHVALKPILLGSAAAQRAGVRHVVNAVTGLGYVFTRGGLKRSALRLCVSRWLRTSLHPADTRVIFQNPDDMGLFIAEGLARQEQSTLIPGSGVDTSRFAPTPEPDGAPVIVFAARMLWDKGAGELVKAARLLRLLKLPFRIVLAGRPDEDNPASISQHTLREWASQPDIEWQGYVEDMPALLAQSHIACLPTTYREGVPLSLLEAASAARPIVTTDAPGCRDIVHHNVNGFLVPPHDVESLADALVRLVTSKRLREQMGLAGRERVLDGFSVEAVTRRTLALYEKMLAGQHERSVA